MPASALFDDLIDGALAAAIDDSLWPGWLQQLTHRVGANGVMMVRADSRVGGMSHYNSDLDRPRAFEEYFSTMQHFDPQVRFVFNPRRKTVYANAHLIETHAQTADYMHWQEDRLGWARHVTFATLPLDGRCSALAVHFGSGARREERLFLTAMAQASATINSVIALGHTHGERLQAAYWEGVSARSDDCAVLLVDEYGCVMRMNARAEAMLVEDTAFTLSRGRMAVAPVGLSRTVDHMVHNATRRVSPRPATLRIPAERGDWVMDIIPIAWARRLLVYREPAALVLLRTLQPPVLALEMRWQRLFGLTPAEAQVADAIRRGLNPEEIAEASGVRLNTIRTHIKAILAKTETHRLATLAGILGHLA